jgi:peptide/nickel transport system substrate-binding protein
VKFHDGSALDVEDVKASFDRAMSYPGSELTGLLSTIKDLQIEDDLNFKIITSDPDPLLLQRLSMILIVPSEYRDRKMETPVGTGSYEFDSWDVGKKITLKSFDGYWGEKSKFEKVEMYSVADKFDRVDMLINGDADLLAFVPYDGVDYVKENGFNIVSVPSLEVQFLLFNMRSNRLMSNIKNREFVSFSVNQKSLIDAIGGYARSVSQFVGSGIFGFSPYIPDHVYDFDAAAELAKETGLVGKTVQFHLGQGLTVLGDYLREKLGEMGVNVVVSYLNESDLLKSMESGKADIYFLGFKSGIGDSSSFLSFIPYSDGPYNYLGYKNEYVDKLIKGSLMEMNFFSRQNDLQEAMKIIVEEDVIGVPLFEYEVVYAFNDKVIINPRIDGIIYFDELIVN